MRRAGTSGRGWSGPLTKAKRRACRSFSIRQCTGDLARAFDEQFGDRAEGTIFQSNDANRTSRDWEIDRQYFEREAFATETDSRFGQNREKATGRH